MSMAAGTTRGMTMDRVSSYAAAVKRISWGAVFAGTIIAVVTQLMLGLLGMGIGIASVDPATATSETGKAFGIGMAIWWVVSSLISLFIGGWVAGRLAGFPKRVDGSLHGVVAWAAMTMFSLYLVSTAVGNVLGGTLSVVGQGLQAAGQTAVAANTQPQGTQSQPTVTEQDVERTQQQAQQKMAEVTEDAKQTAQQAKGPVAAAAIWSFVALCLGALAAGLGGGMGAPRTLPVMAATSVSTTTGATSSSNAA
ncbi:MAG TPA: hypothetical protein VD997_09780 [Phycisphaerales bacterium]|nr:hypothetical protein [Phycisphaerales bacterium]